MRTALDNQKLSHVVERPLLGHGRPLEGWEEEGGFLLLLVRREKERLLERHSTCLWQVRSEIFLNNTKQKSALVI